VRTRCERGGTIKRMTDSPVRQRLVAVLAADAMRAGLSRAMGR